MNLNEKTTVPLWSILVAVPCFVGMVSWFSYVAFETKSNSDRIAKLENDAQQTGKDIVSMREDNLKVLLTIREDIAVIKSKLSERR